MKQLLQAIAEFWSLEKSGDVVTSRSVDINPFPPVGRSTQNRSVGAIVFPQQLDPGDRNNRWKRVNKGVGFLKKGGLS